MSHVETGVQQYLRAGFALDKKFGPYADLAARNAIPTEDRYPLMIVGVEDVGNGKGDIFYLKGDITQNNWEVFGNQPAIENRFANIADLTASQNLQTDRAIQLVIDATDDPTIDAGYAYYEYLGTINGNLTDYRFVGPGGAGAVIPTFDTYEKVYYVETNGDNGTAEVNNPLKSYALPSAAVAAALTEITDGKKVCIKIGPGAFQDNDIARTGIDIVASDNTIVWNTSGRIISDWFGAGTFNIYGGQYYITNWSNYSDNEGINIRYGSEVNLYKCRFDSIQTWGSVIQRVNAYDCTILRHHGWHNYVRHTYHNCTFEMPVTSNRIGGSQCIFTYRHCIFNYPTVDQFNALLPINDFEGNLVTTLVHDPNQILLDTSGMTQQQVIDNGNYAGNAVVPSNACVHIREPQYSNWGVNFGSSHFSYIDCSFMIYVDRIAAFAYEQNFNSQNGEVQIIRPRIWRQSPATESIGFILTKKDTITIDRIIKIDNAIGTNNDYGVTTLTGYVELKKKEPESIADHSGLNLDDGSNPHGTTKADVGLDQVDNTSDANKPVSTATQAALDIKTEEAPQDGKQYARKNASWEEVLSGGGGETIQAITINEATKTNPIVLDANANVIEITLAVDLTSDAKPSDITGWVKGRNYQFHFVKQGTFGFDGSDAYAAGHLLYDDSIDPFNVLSYINTTVKRSVLPISGFVNAGMCGRMLITSPNYVEP